jgi:hypothetical protein
MFAFSFFTSLAVTAGLFLPWPVSADIHLHIAKGGHWRLTVRSDCRLLFGEGGKEGERQLEEHLKEAREMMEAELGGEVEYHAEFTGEREIKTFLSCESDDVCDLIKLLRASVGEDQGAFSWDGNCLMVSGLSHKSEAAFVIDLSFLSPGSWECALTTDGKIAVAELPGKLDESRQRLIFDPIGNSKASADRRTLKIEGLAIKPAGH